MCGYCTEAIALQIAHDLRLTHQLPADMIGESYFFMHILQEDDELLSRAGGTEALDRIITTSTEPLNIQYAAMLLARKRLAEGWSHPPSSPRGEYWLEQAAHTTGIQHSEEPLALLQQFMDTQLQSAQALEQANNDESFDSENTKSTDHFDVYACLPALIEGVLLASANATLLQQLVASYPRETPFFDGGILWLQRAALLTLWQHHGLTGILPLIPLHARPLLLLYLHNKIGLPAAELAQLAEALRAEGEYSSPSAEYAMVLEELKAKN